MTLMILGTSSNAGKTTVCAFLCRHFTKKGLKIIPYKASNLSLNSYVTESGAEIGIGQALQAWACNTEPEAEMKVNASFFIMDPIDCATIYDQVGTTLGLCIKDGVIQNPPLFLREALLVKKTAA